MYRVATITFHHAHNFGSVLQTYALQEYVKSLFKESEQELDYKIIDFYTKKQEELYCVFKANNNIKNIIKNIGALFYFPMLNSRHKKFEYFLNKYCRLTKRYLTREQLLREPPIADCYISGSDQIWNVRAKDFSSVYYLDFLPKESRRVSYAASLGPLKIQWEDYNSEKYKKCLKKYIAISVREQGSAQSLSQIAELNYEIHIDPTLLLTAEKWRKIQSTANYRHGKYILLYCLEPTKEQMKMAQIISQKLKLPILVLRYNNKNDIFNRFIKRYDAGPTDFLSYIDHSALVLTSSFHGTAFSLIYQKPFYVLHGIEDHRIFSILSKVNLLNRSLESIEDIKRVTLDPLESFNIENFLEYERWKAHEYLKTALQTEVRN